MFLNQLQRAINPQYAMNQAQQYQQMANQMMGQAPSGQYGSPGGGMIDQLPSNGPGMMPPPPPPGMGGVQTGAPPTMSYGGAATGGLPSGLSLPQPGTFTLPPNFQPRPAAPGGMMTTGTAGGQAMPQNPGVSMASGGMMNTTSLPPAGSAPPQASQNRGIANAQARQQQMQRGAFSRPAGTTGRPQNIGTRPNPSTAMNNYSRGLQQGSAGPVRPPRPLGAGGLNRR